MIKIEGLSYRYDINANVLEDVTLSVATGESVGIVGPNGAGKSTLISHLNGVLFPAQGTVTVDNLPVNRTTLDAVRRKVGLVFQNPDDMLFMLRIIDDVLFGLRNLGMDDHAAFHAAEKVLKELELWELRERPPFTLSQGQRRFAAMACVLVMEPSVLVLDEPTSDLDPRHRRKLITLLNGLAVTRVVVSHDLDFVWDTCTRVVLLAKGKIVADGDAKEILSNKSLLEENGLELPIRLQK